ncbi:uncharacterized protein LOC127725377 isoform X2 [Mytilus californianus]|uniref:uncharacterized protein LOC127725377 isoform X2 n=1 Tax=Mytilus californianus TaxID=6549 RepID=UPI0022477A5A|nr:uncharacterized protein LOC127725377 isoform X2 [Mytilus californianus]
MNFKCFEHSADFIPGMKITENIEYAMINSAKTVFILTQEYNKSYWCQYEVEFAILKLLAEMKENVIIPVLKEECEIPGYLRPFTYINGMGDMNVWLPKLALAIEAEGQEYNHELSLNRVRDAVNRNRNLDLLHQEKSHFSCRGPVFRWKYVPESLSIPPMKGRLEMKHTLLEVNRRLLPNKVMVTYKRQRLTANFTIFFLFFDMTSCVNHMASELHNKRIRESQNREMVVLNMNDDDDEALLDDITGDSVTCDEQETVTNYLLDLSSAYLKDYMNEKLEHAGDNNRHATKAKCICQFAESLEFKKNADRVRSENF